MDMKRTAGAMLMAAALARSAAAACAQSYPTKPVRVLIGFSAGSELDVVGRLVAQKMAEGLGQQLVVENRTGAGGTLAAAQVAAADADGYTLLINYVSHAGVQALYPKLPYDTLRDFAAVALVASFPTVLVVNPALKVDTVRGFLELARANPGRLSARR